MIKKLFLFFAFFTTLAINAQYTTVINSNRPGFSESPYSVGNGVYQFESSVFFRKAPVIPTFSNPQALGLDLLFRTSFFTEKLELNLNTTLQSDKIAFKNVFESSYSKTGLSKLTLGGKYLIYTPTYKDKKKEIRSWRARHSFDWNRWIPHIGVYAGVNFGSILTDYHQKGGVNTKVGVLLQNEFSKQLHLITNLYYNYIGSDFSEYSYIITGTYNFNDYWSGFAELQGVFEKYEQKSDIGIGAAYLYSENLQFNASLRGMLQQKELGIYTSLGVSYRLDRHQDKFVEVDEFGNKIEYREAKVYDENKVFFGRLFAKVKSLFKKKEKHTVTLKQEGKKEEEITFEKPRRQRSKSLVDIIAKEDKKEKKKTTKAEKKAAKKDEKQAKKEATRKEKERLKLEKDIKKQEEKETKRKIKERLKLEKEIKKQQEKETKRKEEERLKIEKALKKEEKEKNGN